MVPHGGDYKLPCRCLLWCCCRAGARTRKADPDNTTTSVYNSTSARPHKNVNNKFLTSLVYSQLDPRSATPPAPPKYIVQSVFAGRNTANPTLPHPSQQCAAGRWHRHTARPASSVFQDRERDICLSLSTTSALARRVQRQPIKSRRTLVTQGLR